MRERATQDRAPAERAARNFCYGLKNLFKNVWEIPYLVHVMDGLPYTVRVGRELAVTAHAQQNDVIYEWHGEWATWKDLQDSSELKELMRKSEELVARTSRGMKGGKASGRGSLPHYGLGHMGTVSPPSKVGERDARASDTGDVGRHCNSPSQFRGGNLHVNTGGLILGSWNIEGLTDKSR